MLDPWTVILESEPTESTPIGFPLIPLTPFTMSNFMDQNFASDEEEDDFNPVNQDDSDADEVDSKVSTPVVVELEATWC